MKKYCCVHRLERNELQFLIDLTITSWWIIREGSLVYTNATAQEAVGTETSCSRHFLIPVVIDPALA